MVSIGVVSWIGSSQLPEFDIDGDIIGLLDRLTVFFLNVVRPLVVFPIRCWISWFDVDINSGANFSVRSYHRMAMGKIWGGWETASKLSCS
jgi:hypothetical protein